MRKSILILLFLSFLIYIPNCKPQSSVDLSGLLALFGGTPNVNLVPGKSADLDGNGSQDGIVLDTNGDGVADGIATGPGNIPDILLVDTNGDHIPDAIDADGDGIVDYYICYGANGKITINLGSNCQGQTVIIIDTNSDGIPDGYDTDGNGSVDDNSLSQIHSDSTAPNSSASPNGGSFANAQTVTITCSDSVAPGNIIYTTDGSIPSFSPLHGKIASPPNTEFTIGSQGNGTYTVQFLCRDLAGNSESSVHSAVFTLNDNIPAISLTGPSSYISNISGAVNSSGFTWSSNQAGTYSIRKNASSCSDGVVLESGSVLANIANTGPTILASSLSVGNNSFLICVSSGLTGTKTFTVTRDDTPPTVTPTPTGGSFGESKSVSLSCSDTGGSGCDIIAYSLQTGSSPADPSINGSNGAISSGTEYSVPLSPADSSITYIKYTSRDNAGNTSSVIGQTYTIDTNVATVTVSSSTSVINGSTNASVAWQSSKAGNYQFRIGGSDCSDGTALSNGSGNSNVAGSIAAGGPDTSTTISNSSFNSGSNTVRICVSNLIGNFGSATRTVTKDGTSPAVTIDSPVAGTYPTGTTFSSSCSDPSGSGCDKIAYTTDGNDPVFDSSGVIQTGTLYGGATTIPTGTSVVVKVRAVDLAKNVSTVTSRTYSIGPPGSPTLNAPTEGSSQISLSWSSVSGATSYKVYYKTGTSVSTSDSIGCNVTATNCNVTGLTNGTTYSFGVTAIHDGGESTISNKKTGVPTAIIPANGAGDPLEIQYCNIQWPLSISTTAGTSTAIYGQVYQFGYTEASGASSSVIAQFGFGPAGSDPTLQPSLWQFATATFNVQTGNNDEYTGNLVAPSTSGSYLYTFRFSIDAGAHFTYCDLDGAGRNSGLSFSPAQLAPLTVSP